MNFENARAVCSACSAKRVEIDSVGAKVELLTSNLLDLERKIKSLGTTNISFSLCIPNFYPTVVEILDTVFSHMKN